MSTSRDTAGILANSPADADWKQTLERAEQLYRVRQERQLAEREERESGRTIPEWKRWNDPSWS